MKKTFLSTFISMAALCSISYGSEPLQVNDQPSSNTSEEISASDISDMKQYLENQHSINQLVQEVTRPAEAGTTINPRDLYRLRIQTLATVYKLEFDNSITNTNERYRELGRRINSAQLQIAEEVRKKEKLYSKQ